MRKNEESEGIAAKCDRTGTEKKERKERKERKEKKEKKERERISQRKKERNHPGKERKRGKVKNGLLLRRDLLTIKIRNTIKV